MALSVLSPASWLDTRAVGWHHVYILFAALTVLSMICGVFVMAFWKPKLLDNLNEFVAAFGRFSYASFLKPHSADESAGQQAALESFYKAQVLFLVAYLLAQADQVITQAGIYDATRKRLLCGREDMLGLAASQLKFQAAKGAWSQSKPIWVDVRVLKLIGWAACLRTIR